MAASFRKTFSPLNDDDLSELTKKEIMYWAKKLNITPAELFTMPTEQLEKHLKRASKKLDEDKEHMALNETMTNANAANAASAGNAASTASAASASKVATGVSATDKLKKRLKGGTNEALLNIFAAAFRDVEEILSGSVETDSGDDYSGYDSSYDLDDSNIYPSNESSSYSEEIEGSYEDSYLESVFGNIEQPFYPLAASSAIEGCRRNAMYVGTPAPFARSPQVNPNCVLQRRQPVDETYTATPNPAAYNATYDANGADDVFAEETADSVYVNYADNSALLQSSSRTYLSSQSHCASPGSGMERPAGRSDGICRCPGNPPPSARMGQTFVGASSPSNGGSYSNSVATPDMDASYRTTPRRPPNPRPYVPRRVCPQSY